MGQRSQKLCVIILLILPLVISVHPGGKTQLGGLKNSPFGKEEYVLTPFGLSPKRCIVEVPNHSVVSETPEGNLLIESKNRTDSQLLLVNDWNCPPPLRPSFNRSDDNSMYTDGWLDNSWYFPSGDQAIGTFTATYRVPGTPTQTTGQVLFYFIGLEDGLGGSLAILQPVLSFNNIDQGWSFCSWYCCPAGVTTHAPAVTGFGAGDSLEGVIENQSDGVYLVQSIVSSSGSDSSLTASTETRVFDWADVTLETYGVSSCEQFPEGAMTFSNMKMEAIGGAAMTPQWEASPPTECGGTLTIENPETIYIEHNQSGVTGGAAVSQAAQSSSSHTANSGETVSQAAQSSSSHTVNSGETVSQTAQSSSSHTGCGEDGFTS